MKTLLLSAFVIFGPLFGCVLLFVRTFRLELSNLKGEQK
jgi:hypothetical protein